MTEMSPYQDVQDDRESIERSDSDASDVDDDDLPLCYDQPRHTEQIKGADREDHSWRVKEKYKTHCVALVLCLNVGVDPPDVVKTQPCARLECWIDPNSLSAPKALETIGQALQAQYERWQPRARYKLSLDPTSEEVKKLCCSLRRNAKDERVLFHYNGHGVPKPTPQGEIWVFNRAYTQYIPLSMYDLQTWMGAPSLYVYDCSSAGLILDSFTEFAKQHERDYEAALAARGAEGAAGAEGAGSAEGGGGGGAPPLLVSYRNCIQLGACAAGQTLPMHPELPADLFTACLTTPVKMAMRWFVLRHARPHLQDLIDKIPGQVTDRRTMLGELNWIFTAVTDTIAWSSLPPDLFQQLFRADLLTASLCRNFLLADRIMRSYNCTPVSLPVLPSLALHPLWCAWEHTLDLALAQLPQLLSTGGGNGGSMEYRHSAFFRDQLTAFGVWLELGSSLRPPPAQLPMVLQVLLSTLHRLRALHILCRFLALGPWAVRAVLNVGIFPYMLKLLQASAHDLRASMVYIWAKIIAVDPSCQVDLVNAKGHKYFLSVLQDHTVDSLHRTLAAYVLACIVDNYRGGQEAALQGNMISVCLEQAESASWRLRLWAVVGLGRLWRGYDAARGAAARDLAHEKLAVLLHHQRPDLRAAAAFALGTLLAGGGAPGALHHQVGAVLAACTHTDASPLVRAELLAALQYLVLGAEPHFVAVCLLERQAKVDPGHDALLEPPRPPHPLHPPHHAKLQLPAIGFGSVYMKLWEALRAMSREPHPQVSSLATDIISHVSSRLDNAPTSSAPPAAPPRRVKLPSVEVPPPAPVPIVHTQFVEWCCSEIARPDRAVRTDPESRPYHERAWRTARNRSLRKQAQELLCMRGVRVESQAFHSRCSLPPQVVLFHPYDQHAAVAFKDNFGIWDWGTAAKLCVGGWRRQWGRITALAYLNATSHAPILCVAGHTGNVALYRAGGGGGAGTEPALVSAWRALPAVSAAPRPPAARPAPGLGQLVSEQFGGGGGGGGGEGGATPPPAHTAGTLLRWCGARCTLAAGGAAPIVRVWDARAERLLCDVPTQCDHPAASMWRPPDDGRGAGGAGADEYTLCAGFVDGTARAWDERAPGRPVQTLPAGAGGAAHTSAVVCCTRRPDRSLWVLVGADGRVVTYDTRTMRQVDAYRSVGPLGAADVHPLAELVACGSVEQCVSVYDLRGTLLTTIKSYEGFMGARIGPVSCLAFHPLRCALAVGSRDLAVSVYVSDPRR